MKRKATKKPTIVFICGKSASGKSSIAKCLSGRFVNKQEIQMIKLDTTRPKRGLEDRDYTFISEQAYLEREKSNQYILSNKFRNWYYGLPFSSFQKDKINLCVAAPKDLARLAEQFSSWNTCVIYLDVLTKIRLKRSVQRGGHPSFEIFRRLITDYFDFKDIDKILSDNFKQEDIFYFNQTKEGGMLSTISSKILPFIQGKIVD